MAVHWPQVFNMIPSLEALLVSCSSLPGSAQPLNTTKLHKTCSASCFKEWWLCQSNRYQYYPWVFLASMKNTRYLDLFGTSILSGEVHIGNLANLQYILNRSLMVNPGPALGPTAEGAHHLPWNPLSPKQQARSDPNPASRSRTARCVGHRFVFSPLLTLSLRCLRPCPRGARLRRTHGMRPRQGARRSIGDKASGETTR